MTVTRRELLSTSIASLSLPSLLRLRAAETPRERTAIILVWLRGGCSHLDTYDPKPDAGDAFCGPFKPIATRTPGLRFTELLPRQARLSHRYAVVRSLAHTGGGHPAGSLQVLTGDPDSQDKQKAIYPDWMTVATRLRGGERRTLPSYVGVNPITTYDGFGIAGPGYVGPGYEPFAVMGDPSSPGFRVPNVGSASPARVETLRERVSLRSAFDGFKREADKGAGMRDRFEQQALDLLTSPAAARAFDLAKEPTKLRERYGMNAWGQQLLMARRLVEAGVEIITSVFDGPLCGRVANWDDHAVNHHIFDALKFRAPVFDQAVSALIEDVFDRGLDRRVMVVVTGEFGRTPRISRTASSGGGVASGAMGTVQPGRDHWPRAGSMLWAGGGISGGQIVGATDRRGEDVIEKRMGPQDFLATLYRHLGIDYDRVTLPDLQGRPTPIVRDGKAMPELGGA